MTRSLRLDPLRIVLTLILAVALTAIGFAHRIPTVKDQTLASYELAQGILICGDGDDHGSGHGSEDCPACHLAGAVIVPADVVTLRDADLRFVAEVIAPRESRAVRPALDPAHGLRAPPAA